jgi:hypothetical protein
MSAIQMDRVRGLLTISRWHVYVRNLVVLTAEATGRSDRRNENCLSRLPVSVVRVGNVDSIDAISKHLREFPDRDFGDVQDESRVSLDHRTVGLVFIQVTQACSYAASVCAQYNSNPANSDVRNSLGLELVEHLYGLRNVVADRRMGGDPIDQFLNFFPGHVSSSYIKQHAYFRRLGRDALI